MDQYHQAQENLDGLARMIVSTAHEVSRQLGGGFLKRIYEMALAIELRDRDMKVETQVALPVETAGKGLRRYVADILVADRVMVVLKCVHRLSNDHMAQCTDYLLSSGLQVCLLINFQHPHMEWKRIVHNRNIHR